MKIFFRMDVPLVLEVYNRFLVDCLELMCVYEIGKHSGADRGFRKGRGRRRGGGGGSG